MSSKQTAQTTQTPAGASRTYDRVKQTVYRHTLDNGLTVVYLPKPDFSYTFAMLAVNFGAVDARFTPEGGGAVQLPAGVAHFLEHKMFEDEDGNALQKFAATGASPNAFTSHNMTAYHFSCTDRFEENLTLLLRFVFTPYFTEDNVQKEKGIIAQEIGMMDDQPFWQAFNGLHQALYHTHPLRESIAGSVDSIAAITPSLLDTCYHAFYHPANMALVVCGQADFDQIVALAEQHSPQSPAIAVHRDYGTRQETVCQAAWTCRMAVSRPHFLVGFKDIPVQDGEDFVRRQLLGELCCRILAGEGAPLYAALYRDRLINRQFEAAYSQHPQAAYAHFTGTGPDPQAVHDQLVQAVRTLAGQGVDPDRFERARRAAYGATLRTLDQPGELCRAQCEALFGGGDLLDFPAAYDAFTPADAQAMFARWAAPGRAALAAVYPADGEGKG